MQGHLCEVWHLETENMLCLLRPQAKSDFRGKIILSGNVLTKVVLAGCYGDPFWREALQHDTN